MMRDAALAGLGMAMLPSFIVGQDIRAGTLKVVDIGLQAAPEYLYVAHPEGRKVSAKLRALVDWLRTAFGDPPYWEVGRRGDASHPRQQPAASDWIRSLASVHPSVGANGQRSLRDRGFDRPLHRHQLSLGRG
jgi:hypothetical protein